MPSAPHPLQRDGGAEGSFLLANEIDGHSRAGYAVPLQKRYGLRCLVAFCIHRNIERPIEHTEVPDERRCGFGGSFWHFIKNLLNFRLRMISNTNLLNK